ncbi:SGNH/GDSL hydrolase family protein [Jiangella alkaliphila]|uniref:Lysophospholipase L1 n=1 Tax=Jiangella alkaliphila TaxID=419479 RepID=A0A1H2LRK4_9ACTN|nr:SGNH/GDSL hydrolase family protein [Jiangella alkaliphila]SDU83494.1 Lysophospholipase L1 [Jiangella alkaliphila]
MSVRLVALGDSTVCGMGDPLPDGSWRGFAGLLAATFPTSEYTNLAVSGARTPHVRHGQLAAALELRPDLACLLVGVNDTMRSDFAPAVVRAHLTETAAALTGSGATLLTARVHNHARVFGLPPLLGRPLWRRLCALNEIYDEVYERFGGVRVDLTSVSWIYERANWSVDRLHPSELGHRRLAHAFAVQLRDAGWPVAELPSLTASGGLPPTPLADLRWMLVEGVPWAGRKARDLVPWAATLAGRELLRRARLAERSPAS